MTTGLSVVERLSLVMNDVQAVRKGDRNTQQNFNFRGIDAVVNAVGPALRSHGVVVVPQAEEISHESYETRSGTQMRNTTVRVRFRFCGPAGDSIEAVTFGEASDAGDKSVSKAMSVAFRTALLQALCIPTDEPDPDASSFERGTAPRGKRQPKLTAEQKLLADIKQHREELGWSSDDVAADFEKWCEGGTTLLEADPETLTSYLLHLRQQGVFK